MPVYETTAQWQDKSGALRTETIRSGGYLIPGMVMHEDIFSNERCVMLADDNQPIVYAVLGILLGIALIALGVLEWLGVI